jgi:CDP-diacylglycerol--serine O-phosphatidyltransferase
MIISQEPRLAFSLILIAVLADGLDGVIARKIGYGKLGEVLEAMADMISLSVAVGVFVFYAYYSAIHQSLIYQGILVIILAVFIVASVIRLGSFSLLKEKDYFIGLPASASAIIILILAYFEIYIFSILLIIFILSLAMMSRIHFPKTGVKMNGIGAILIIVTVIFGKTYGGLAPVILLAAVVVYSIGGLLYRFYQEKIAILSIY